MNYEFSRAHCNLFAEFVHEKAHARSRRANHFRQRFLTDFPTIGSGLASNYDLAVRGTNHAMILR
jgi:hypothetical protein